MKELGLAPFSERNWRYSDICKGTYLGEVLLLDCAKMCCNRGFKNLFALTSVTDYLYWFLKGILSMLNSLGNGKLLLRRYRKQGCSGKLRS